MPVFKCQACDRSFLYKHSLDSHLILKKHQVFKCKECDKRFISRKEFENHEMEHQPSTCKLCGKKYSKPFYFREHMKRHEAEALQCKVCSKAFLTKAALDSHQELHNRVEGILIGATAPQTREVG